MVLFLSSYYSTSSVNTIENLLVKPSTNWTIRYLIFALLQSFPIACAILSFIFFAAQRRIFGEIFTIPTQIALYITTFISIITLLAYLSLTTTSSFNILSKYLSYEKYYKLGLIGIYSLLLTISYFSIKFKLSLNDIKTIKENLIFISMVYNIVVTFAFVVYDNIQYSFDNILQYNTEDLLNLYSNNDQQLNGNYGNTKGFVNSAITDNTNNLNSKFNSLTYDAGSILFNNALNTTNSDNTKFAKAIQNYYNSIITILGLNTNLDVTDPKSPIMLAVFSYLEQDHRNCGAITQSVINNINSQAQKFSIQNSLEQILTNDLNNSTSGQLTQLINQQTINTLKTQQIDPYIQTAMQNSIQTGGAIDTDLKDDNSSLSQGLTSLITTKITSDNDLTTNFLNFVLSQIDPNTQILNSSNLSNFVTYMNDDIVGLFKYCATNNVFSSTLDPLINNIISGNATVKQNIINLFQTKSSTSFIDQSLPTGTFLNGTIQSVSDTISQNIDLKTNIDLILLGLIDPVSASGASSTSNFDTLIQTALDNVFYNKLLSESGISSSIDSNDCLIQYIRGQLNINDDTTNNTTFLEQLLYAVNSPLSTTITVSGSNKQSFGVILEKLLSDSYTNDPTFTTAINNILSNLYASAKSSNINKNVYFNLFENFFTKINYLRQLSTASTLNLTTDSQTSFPTDMTSKVSLFFDYFIINGGFCSNNYSIGFQPNIINNVNGLDVFFPELNLHYIYNSSSNFLSNSYIISGSNNTPITYSTSLYNFLVDLNKNKNSVIKNGNFEIAAIRVNNFLLHDILIISGKNFFIMFLPNGQFICIRDVGTVVNNNYGVYDVLTSSDVNGYLSSSSSGTNNIYEYSDTASILPALSYTQNNNFLFFSKNSTTHSIITNDGMYVYLNNSQSSYIKIKTNDPAFTNCTVLALYDNNKKSMTAIFDSTYYSLINIFN